MADDPASFLVARNPDPDSSLPYLLRIPLEGGILLKARDRWPTTARVYCHPLDEWPPDAEIVEAVAVRHCQRRGAAIDLVLDRGRNNRSQIVFTKPNPGRANGRPMIFWQTARTAQRARPGQRVPTRRASVLEQLTIDVDSRERYPYKFAGRPVERQRTALPVGDYAIRDGDQLIACVERKTPEDFAKSLVDGSLNYALAELAALPAAAVVVEARYGALLDNQHTQPGWLLELVARLQVRYPRSCSPTHASSPRNTPTASSPPHSSTTHKNTRHNPTTAVHRHDVVARAAGRRRRQRVIYVTFIVWLVLAGRRTDARALAGFISDCIVLFRRLLADQRVPRSRKLLLAALIGYLAMPFDLVPDFIPVAGQLDDAIIVALVLRTILRSAGADLLHEHWPGPDTSLNALARLAYGQHTPS